jgi:hypothetical protein
MNPGGGGITSNAWILIAWLYKNPLPEKLAADFFFLSTNRLLASFGLADVG